MSLSPLRKEIYVGKFLQVNQHISRRYNLFTLSSNYWNLIRYFLTLTRPHSRANLWETGSGWSGRQCIIPATLSGSAVKDNIRSARGQPVCEYRWVIPLSPSFVRAGEQRCSHLCYRPFFFFLPGGLNWMEWERSLQFSKKAWGWILL